MDLLPEDRERLVRYIDFMESELADFPKFKKISWKSYNNDRDVRRNLERWVENIVNCSIDTAKVILASEDARIPSSYKGILIEKGDLGPSPFQFAQACLIEWMCSIIPLLRSSCGTCPQGESLEGKNIPLIPVIKSRQGRAVTMLFTFKFLFNRPFPFDFALGRLITGITRIICPLAILPAGKASSRPRREGKKRNILYGPYLLQSSA